MRPITQVPANLSGFDLALAENGSQLIYTYNTHQDKHDVSDLIESLKVNNILPKEIKAARVVSKIFSFSW